MSDMIAKMRDEMDRCLPDAVPHQTLEMVSRAVLKILREPTDEMVENGSGHISDDHVLVDEYEKEAKLCWQAMIDAALHSGKEDAT